MWYNAIAVSELESSLNEPFVQGCFDQYQGALHYECISKNNLNYSFTWANRSSPIAERKKCRFVGCDFRGRGALVRQTESARTGSFVATLNRSLGYFVHFTFFNRLLCCTLI